MFGTKSKIAAKTGAIIASLVAMGRFNWDIVNPFSGSKTHGGRKTNRNRNWSGVGCGARQQARARRQGLYNKTVNVAGFNTIIQRS